MNHRMFNTEKYCSKKFKETVGLLKYQEKLKLLQKAYTSKAEFTHTQHFTIKSSVSVYKKPSTYYTKCYAVFICVFACVFFAIDIYF